MGKLTYLATPYFHPDPAVMEKRFRIVNKVAARLMNDGVLVFSPISQNHPIALAGGLPRGWEFWKEYDSVILGTCGKVIVLKQEGWEKSVGVNEEVKMAKDMGIPVEYMECPDE